MPIILKSTTSSFLFSISCSKAFNRTERFFFLISTPLSMARETSLPWFRNTSRFCSTASSSACRISCCNSGDCGIIPN
ncbi:hypothetical protein ACFP3I_11915 [Chryseobacterium arachidis]|uniref:hypothetical protein n=1 Tax=Chryseobacterium arachidis TaxID=1416778 RepID=UPI00361C510C